MHGHVSEHDQHIYSNKKFFYAYLSKFSKLFGDGLCCGWYLISNAHITTFTILWQSRTKNLETARRVQRTTAIWNSLLWVYPTGNFLSFPLVLFHGRESGKSRIPSQQSLCVRKDSPARKDIDQCRLAFHFNDLCAFPFKDHFKDPCRQMRRSPEQHRKRFLVIINSKGFVSLLSLTWFSFYFSVKYMRSRQCEAAPGLGFGSYVWCWPGICLLSADQKDGFFPEAHLRSETDPQPRAERKGRIS